MSFMGMHRRFGSGLTTISLPARIALTVGPVAWLALLTVAFLSWAFDPEDPRFAALIFLMLMVSAAASVFFLREVWRSSTEWQHEQRAERGAVMRQQDLLRERVVREDLDVFGSEKPVD